MATSFSPAQLECFRREAKKLSRELSITHSEALDQIAVQNGFRNWSLLSKHSSASLAVSAVVPPTPRPIGAYRYYLHGDVVEPAPVEARVGHAAPEPRRVLAGAEGETDPPGPGRKLGDPDGIVGAAMDAGHAQCTSGRPSAMVGSACVRSCSRPGKAGATRTSGWRGKSGVSGVW